MKKLFLILALFSICACTETIEHGNFTVLSTRSINYKEFDIKDNSKLDTVGEDSTRMVWLFQLPDSVINPTISNAIDNGLRKANNSDLLINTNIVYRRTVYVGGIYAKTGWRVVGEAIKTNK